MLSNFELSMAIIVTILIQIVTYVILRIKRGAKQPVGSISEQTNPQSEANRTTGNPILWLIAMTGLTIYFITVLRLLGYCLSTSWESSKFYKQAIQFPIWVNYVGITVLWFSGILKGTIMVYNINFTLFFMPMKKDFILATGGPYRFVRHPAYVLHVLWALSVFLMTGIQLLLISLFCYLSYILQAYYEEKALKEIFGDSYRNYASKTGMFFPKLFNRRIQ